MTKKLLCLLLISTFIFLPIAYAQAHPEDLEDAIINVADTVGKSVVTISTEYARKTPARRRIYFKGPQNQFGEDEFFRRFFEDFFGEIPEFPSRRVGMGSGVIVDSKGYILTNEHVVADADKITVKLSDGREFKGEVKGTDKRSDMAIIKIDAQSLPVAGLGNSDALKIGQWVVAIGNPFGFVMDNPEPTVTVGVISALHRSLGKVFQRSRDYGDLIQTDAAINPGNSGGPLVNLKGEIIGINVAIFSTSGGYEGVGFAIPINNVKSIMGRLIEGKKIVYGWLGVSVQALDEKLAKYFGLTGTNGVLVAKTMEKSPAQKAGIKEGDIIRKFNNQPTNSVKELLALVGRAEPGKKVKVIIFRDKKEVPVDVDVGERPENLDEEVFEQENLQGESWRGIKVDSIKETEGVVIADVEPGTPADDVGLSPGDVIVEINRVPVKDIQSYKTAIAGVKGDCLIKTNRGYAVLKGE